MAEFTWTIVDDPAPPTPAAVDPLDDPTVTGTSPAELARDLLLDTTGDLKVEGNDLVIARGADAIAQDVAQRVKMVRGDYFLDLDKGLPYFEDVFVKNPNLPAFRAELREAILEAPGVKDVLEIAFTEDKAERTLTVDIRASTDVGELRLNSLPLSEL